MGVDFTSWIPLGWGALTAATIAFILLARRRSLPLATLLTLATLYYLGGAVGTLVVPSILGATLGGLAAYAVGRRLLAVREPRVGSADARPS